MTQKTALILAAVLTAFVLVIGGGLIARISQPDAAKAAAPAAALIAPAPAADAAAQVQELVAQREAQYRQLLDEANRRLEAANQQLTAQSAAPSVAQAAPALAPAQPAAPQITLSPDSARDIAVQAASFATMIRTPELVRFEGQVAYEIGFTRGVVYIDANSGAVLFNGAQGGNSPSAEQPSSDDDRDHDDDHGGEHEDDHGEHESEHGDDHD